MEILAGTTGASHTREFSPEIAAQRAAVGVRGVGAAMAAGGVALTALPAFGTLCPLRRTTGVPCPLCGMTTGTFAMVRGDIGAAFLANPLAPLLLAVVLLAFVPPLWRWLWAGVTHARSVLDGPDEESRSRWWILAPISAGLWIYQLHRFDHL